MNGRGAVAIGDLVDGVKTWNPARRPLDELFDYIDIGAVDQNAKVVVGARRLACGEAVLRPREGVLESGYLFHWVRSPEFVKQMVRAATGASYPAVSDRIVLGSRLPVLPLREQRRIAEVLDGAEALRAKRRVARARLDSLMESAFLDLFGDPIQNPHGFPVRPLVELIDSQRPISYGILKPGPHQQDGVRYVRVVDMQDGGINSTAVRRTSQSISDAYRRSLLTAGDILLSIRGHVGRLAIVPPDLDGANITQDTARLAVVGAFAVFVRECLRTEGFKAWMARHTKGAAVRGINLGDVKLMPIILPPVAVQESFARRVAAIDKLKAAHRASLAHLDALFASLQHRAFRGEL